MVIYVYNYAHLQGTIRDPQTNGTFIGLVCYPPVITSGRYWEVLLLLLLFAFISIPLHCKRKSDLWYNGGNVEYIFITQTWFWIDPIKNFKDMKCCSWFGFFVVVVVCFFLVFVVFFVFLLFKKNSSFY